MCLLITFYKVIPDYYLVLAANREESYTRLSTPPGLISTNPAILGGQDNLAGGTWLGINKTGLAVGITNRGVSFKDNFLRSRGLLCLDLLREISIDIINLRLPQFLEKDKYNSFNLFFGDNKSAFLAIYEDELISQKIQPGINIIVNKAMSKESYKKNMVIQEKLEILPKVMNPQFINDMMNILKFHMTDPPNSNSICAHSDNHGTVSSSIIALHENFPNQSIYYYSDGPPCQTAYQDYSQILKKLI